jgi:hypothetical protein
MKNTVNFVVTAVLLSATCLQIPTFASDEGEETVTSTLGIRPEVDPSASRNYSLSDIQGIVEGNFEKVHDLRVEVEKYYPVATAAKAASPQKRTYVWAFTRAGKAFRSSSVRCPVDHESPAPLGIAAFNGEVVKHIGFNSEDPKTPEGGTIWPNQEAFNMLIRDPAAHVECGRFWGKIINARSLSQWLSHEGARIVREELIQDNECVVVEVPHRLGDQPDIPRLLRFWLAKEDNFALVRYESWVDEAKRLTCTTTELTEIAPGVWFPVAGVLDSHGRGEAQRLSFKVLQVEANQGLPDSLFEIEFPPGLPVFDVRFRPAVEYVWEEALDPTDPDWIAEMEQREGVTFQWPPLVTGEEAPELDVAEWVKGDPKTLAALRGRTVVLGFWDHSSDASADLVQLLNYVLTSYSPGRVEVISVHSPDPDLDALKKLISDTSVKFRVALDKPAEGHRGTFAQYWVSEVPAVYIIDTEGKVRYQDIPLEAVEEAVTRLLYGQ